MTTKCEQLLLKEIYSDCKEYYCDLTEDFDKHVLDEYIDLVGRCMRRTIIMVCDNAYYIRFLGATRGKIEVDNSNMIISIDINEDICFSGKIRCYKKSVVECFDKYIGARIMIK